MKIRETSPPAATGDVRITVAATVRRNDRFLFVEEHSRGRLVLSQPAGHWEPGESLVEAVIRETLEESAYRFTPVAVSGVHFWHDTSRERTIVRINFVGSVGEQDAARALDDGIERTLWLSPAQLQGMENRLRSPLVLRAVEDHLAGKRYPLSVVDTLPTGLLQRSASA